MNRTSQMLLEHLTARIVIAPAMPPCVRGFWFASHPRSIARTNDLAGYRDVTDVEKLEPPGKTELN